MRQASSSLGLWLGLWLGLRLWLWLWLGLGFVQVVFLFAVGVAVVSLSAGPTDCVAGVVFTSLVATGLASFDLGRLAGEGVPLPGNNFLFVPRRCTLSTINFITPCGSGTPPLNFGIEQIFHTMGFKHLTTFVRNPSLLPVGVASGSLVHCQIPRVLLAVTCRLEFGERLSTSAKLIGVDRVLVVKVCSCP